MTKQGGMARAYRHADPAWKQAAHEAVLECAKILPKFTTDDVLLIIDPTVSTHEMRALGPIMRRAAKDEWIVKSLKPPMNCVTRPSNHNRPLQVWESLLFRGKKPDDQRTG